MISISKTLHVGWVVMTVSLVVIHVHSRSPFSDAKDAATLFGLLALAISAVIRVWKWADLAARKAWLMLLNSTVAWTMEVRVEVTEPITSDVFEFFNRLVNDSGKLKRVQRNGDALSIETLERFDVIVKPVHSGDITYWSIRFVPLRIGYRDAASLLRRQLFPIVDELTRMIENRSEVTRYSIEAEFSDINPYAAVLLNDLRAKSADHVLMRFDLDGSKIQVTRDKIVASSDSQIAAVGSMSAVFGISLRGALNASNL